MRFPLTNPWTNKVVHALPYLFLAAVFAAAIWAQAQGCGGNLITAAQAIPSLFVPQRDRAFLRG